MPMPSEESNYYEIKPIHGIILHFILPHNPIFWWLCWCRCGRWCGSRRFYCCTQRWWPHGHQACRAFDEKFFSENCADTNATVLQTIFIVKMIPLVILLLLLVFAFLLLVAVFVCVLVLLICFLWLCRVCYACCSSHLLYSYCSPGLHSSFFLLLISSFVL